MSEGNGPIFQSLTAALAELDAVAPGVPLLALGQTVFWDEPMKAGVALAIQRSGKGRPFLAGVHDTDYFAKVSGGRAEKRRFKALPHNDTTTRNLWSAAGEFSCLFGSETVVTREALKTAGLRVERLEAVRPHFLDEATEAWGWKGIVALGDNAPVTADVRLPELFHELRATLDWALDASLSCLDGEDRVAAEQVADRLRGLLKDGQEADPSATLANLYERLLPSILDLVANQPVPALTTRTSRLLRFNRETCRLPRFEILDLFIRPDTRQHAKEAYNAAVKGSGLYGLDRFGTGAIPFDVYIPGRGRGTLRLGTAGAVINTPAPSFLSYKKAPENVADLAAVLVAKFGPSCAIVGKAVTLIGMLAREHSFVFHDGASNYVKHSRTLHRLLREKTSIPMTFHPILRLRYDAWSELSTSCVWMRLPEPLRRPFGTDDLCAPSFASRWKEVAAEQQRVLDRLALLKRPIELIGFLDELYGGAWKELAREYAALQSDLGQLRTRVEGVRGKRIAMYKVRNQLKERRRTAEREMGDHFRSEVFEKPASDSANQKRAAYATALATVLDQQEEAEINLRALFREQSELARAEVVRKAHSRRRDIELEADLKRARIIQEATLAAKGLVHANHRPSAWWFPLLSPDGLWFRATVDSAECYLEPLS